MVHPDGMVHFLKIKKKREKIHQNYLVALIIRSEMLPFSENNQNTKMFGVPPNTLP